MNVKPRPELPYRPRPSLLPVQLENLKTCCILFRLELGCKLIALFEGLSGLCESYLACKQIQPVQDPWNVPQWKTATTLPPLHHDPQLQLFLGLVTLCSAQLLLAGIVFVSSRHSAG